MICNDILQRSPSGVLTMTRPRNALVSATVLIGASAALWCLFVFAYPLPIILLPHAVQLGALLAPMALFITALIRLSAQLNENGGDLVFSFDPATRTFRRNGKLVALFNDIGSVQIQCMTDLDTSTAKPACYQLNIVLRRGARQVRLTSSSQLQQLEEAAARIAAIVRVDVRRGESPDDRHRRRRAVSAEGI